VHRQCTKCFRWCSCLIYILIRVVEFGSQHWQRRPYTNLGIYLNRSGASTGNWFANSPRPPVATREPSGWTSMENIPSRFLSALSLWDTQAGFVNLIGIRESTGGWSAACNTAYNRLFKSNQCPRKYFCCRFLEVGEGEGSKPKATLNPVLTSGTCRTSRHNGTCVTHRRSAYSIPVRSSKPFK
jgi:hypothetical protein